MSTYLNPIFNKKNCLKFEFYRKDHELESKLNKLVSLREANPTNLKTQEFRELFNACRIFCQKQNFRMGYRLLAFAAFSGFNEYADFPGEVGTALLYALHNAKADLALIDELLIATLNERTLTIDQVAKKIEKIRKLNLCSSKSLNFPFSWIFTPITFGYEKASSLFYCLYSTVFPKPYWQPDEPGDDWIKFSHGGGFQSAYHYFLLKDSAPYESDGSIDGAWVTPYGSGYEHRDLYYACRTPPKHFDTTPAMVFRYVKGDESARRDAMKHLARSLSESNSEKEETK